MWTRIEKTIDRLSRLAYQCAQILTFFLVLLTFEQVVARYFFGASSVGLQELEWHLFALIFLFSTAHALAADAHVRVDVLYAGRKQKTKALIDLFGGVFFLIPTCIILIFFGYSFAADAYTYTSAVAPDRLTTAIAEPNSTLYTALAPIERFFRSWLLVGETSPDPGGLEARWIIKACIPLGFFLLLLQSLVFCKQKIAILRTPEENER